MAAPPEAVLPPHEVPNDSLLRNPVTLRGHVVDLAPLDRVHISGLTEAGQEARIWTYMVWGPRDTPESMAAAVENALRSRVERTLLPFTVMYPAGSGIPVGNTQFMEIRREHRRAEIGGTWYRPDLWGTRVNLESKYLLLRHAFEVEGLERVEFKTDLRNVRSQKALEKIGATREGILRHHMITWNGERRNSVYYSIIAPEWPGVKSHLEGRLLAEEPSH